MGLGLRVEVRVKVRVKVRVRPRGRYHCALSRSTMGTPASSCSVCDQSTRYMKANMAKTVAALLR